MRKQDWVATHELRHRDRENHQDGPPIRVCVVGHRGYTRDEWPDGPASYTIAQYSQWCWHGDTFVGSIRPV